MRSIDTPTVFRDFDDASLDDETREQIRARSRARPPAAADGSIALTARAWAVRGTV